LAQALRPRSVTGDATYGTRENIAAIEKAGIRAYTALADQKRRTALFTIDAFVYDAQRDLYTCPAGETLHRRGHDHRGSYVRYAAKASACNACHLKGKCTKSPKGRWVSRSLEEEYLERVRAYRHTEAYRKALRKRAVWVEPLLRGGQGMARVEALQAKGARESEHRGPAQSGGAKRQAAPGFREHRPEESGSGGRPPKARSLLSREDP
jgi:hypothetical protein